MVPGWQGFGAHGPSTSQSAATASAARMRVIRQRDMSSNPPVEGKNAVSAECERPRTLRGGDGNHYRRFHPLLRHALHSDLHGVIAWRREHVPLVDITKEMRVRREGAVAEIQTYGGDHEFT